MEAITNLLDTYTDTTIIYQGGSGGFLLYYLLLLSGKYVSGDIDIQQSSDIVSTVKQRVSTQFPHSLKDNQSNWKINEFWPDNSSIKDIPLHKNKLFLICNPLFDNRHIVDNLHIASNTRRVLLYTDIDLQLRMAYEKNAYWFTDVSKKRFNAPPSNYSYIRQIISNYKILEKKKVDPRVPDIISLYLPDMLIDLKDLISNTGFNYEQAMFVSHWLSLQSKKAVRCLKI
jgi:hypothetical protein